MSKTGLAIDTLDCHRCHTSTCELEKGMQSHACNAHGYLLDVLSQRL